jgi:hypothetical protein
MVIYLRHNGRVAVRSVFNDLRFPPSRSFALKFGCKPNGVAQQAGHVLNLQYDLANHPVALSWS